MNATNGYSMHNNCAKAEKLTRIITDTFCVRKKMAWE